jgi:hypothetical protein
MRRPGKTDTPTRPSEEPRKGNPALSQMRSADGRAPSLLTSERDGENYSGEEMKSLQNRHLLEH